MPNGQQAQKEGDIFRDDPTIPDDMRLLHRVPFEWYYAPEDRPQSCSFDNSPDGSGTSVDLMEADDQPQRTLAGHPGFGLVSITAGQARAAGLGVVRNPILGNPGNSQHCLLQGKKNKASKKLARQCQWLVRPTTPQQPQPLAQPEDEQN